MIKDNKLLEKTLLDFLKFKLVQFKKDGVVVNFDGTLMSVINICLIKKLNKPFNFKIISTQFRNKYYLTHLSSILKKLDVIFEVKDLSSDINQLLKTSNGSIREEISIQKRMIDLMLAIQSDKDNLIPISNQCYSQWSVDFPCQNYQNLAHIHLLNCLYYSEVIEFAKYLEIDNLIIEREPSHYLFRGQLDRELLGFTYSELEDYLRNATQNRNSIDILISNKLKSDNRNLYICPIIQRPSNILG